MRPVPDGAPRPPGHLARRRGPAEALDRLARLEIVPLPGRDRATAGEAARALVAGGTTGPTARLFVHETTDAGSGLVGFSIPHAWGDATTALGLIRTVVSGPDPDGRLWTHVGTPVERPLTAALKQRFGSLAALRGIPQARRAGMTPGGERSHHVPTPANPAPRPVNVVVIPATIGREPVKALKVWRRERGGGVSMNSVVMAAMRTALLAKGIGLTDGLVVAYDDRLYLPRGSSTRGNFVSALRLVPADACDSSEVQQCVQAAMLAGRPLLALAAASVSATLPRRPPWPARPAAGGTSDLSFACVRTDRVLTPSLVQGDNGENVLVCVTTPASHGSVAAMVLDQGGEIHITLTVHAPLVNPNAGRRALARLAQDPVAFLPRTVHSDTP